jgi:N-carbamoyl-D-amino-acid hydrolase
VTDLPRINRCAVVQMAGISLREKKSEVVDRMIALLDRAADDGARFIVFPELALTTFFPRYWFEDDASVDRFFDRTMPSPETMPLFSRARERSVAFTFGYAERTAEARYNSSILVCPDGQIAGHYRKVHLPGHADNRPHLPFQHLEKRYFSVGDIGFQTWPMLSMQLGLCICNDRRWPETYRVLALRGAEVVALGYNTPTPDTDYAAPDHLAMFHHLLSLQAGAYQNGLWVLAAAKAGWEDGYHLMGGSCIVAPTGEIAVRALGEGDEILVHDCDLNLGRAIRENIFDFAAHRRVEHYGPIVEQTAAQVAALPGDPE